METINLSKKTDWAFIESFKQESGQNPSLCYQCGNCTAGCPYTKYFDYPVSIIMRLLQTGQKEAILNSKAIWICATCETCTTRCPCNIDVALVMDVLRHIARRENKIAEKGIKSFYDSFLLSVRFFSRLYEVGMIGFYMLKYRYFLSAAKLGFNIGPKFATKGKLSFFPYKLKGNAEVGRIFKRYLKIEKEKAKNNG